MNIQKVYGITGMIIDALQNDRLLTSELTLTYFIYNYIREDITDNKLFSLISTIVSFLRSSPYLKEKINPDKPVSFINSYGNSWTIMFIPEVMYFISQLVESLYPNFIEINRRFAINSQKAFLMCFHPIINTVIAFDKSFSSAVYPNKNIFASIWYHGFCLIPKMFSNLKKGKVSSYEELKEELLVLNGIVLCWIGSTYAVNQELQYKFTKLDDTEKEKLIRMTYVDNPEYAESLIEEYKKDPKNFKYYDYLMQPIYNFLFDSESNLKYGYAGVFAVVNTIYLVQYQINKLI